MKLTDIIEVVLKVTGTLERLGIAYHIGGSLASSAFGIPRATLDIDIVADIKAQHISQLYEYLKDEFYIDVDMIKDAVSRQSSFNIIHLESMFKVDIFILKDQAFYHRAFERRIQKNITDDETKKIFFSTPEDIILNKLVWYKSGGEVSDRQWSDILGVLKVQGTKLDLAYMKHWAKELNIKGLLEKAFDEAGFLSDS